MSGAGLIERQPGVRTVVVDDDVIVTNFVLCKCFFLNSTASTVWGAIETPSTIDGICAALRERYAVSADNCRHEVEALMERWTRLGLVRAVD